MITQATAAGGPGSRRGQDEAHAGLCAYFMVFNNRCTPVNLGQGRGRLLMALKGQGRAMEWQDLYLLQSCNGGATAYN